MTERDYRALGDVAVTVARRVVRDGHTAEDCAQEALLRVVVRERAAGPLTSPAGFAAVAAKRVALDELRGRGPLLLGGADGVPDRGESEAAGHARRRAARVRVGRLLATLRPVSRQCVRLFYLEGLSVAEVAIRTGLRRSAVRVRLFRAREAMRRCAP